MKNGRMQAKDVPDLPVLRFIHKVRTEGVYEPKHAEVGEYNRYYHVTWFRYEDEYIPANSVLNAMPAGTPDKVALAKMRRLIARKLVDGCPCGCRGDFELTDAGRQMIDVEVSAHSEYEAREINRAVDQLIKSTDLRSNYERMKDGLRMIDEASLRRQAAFASSLDEQGRAVIAIGGRDPDTLSAEIAFALSNPLCAGILLELVQGQTMQEGFVMIGGIKVSQGAWDAMMLGAGLSSHIMFSSVPCASGTVDHTEIARRITDGAKPFTAGEMLDIMAGPPPRAEKDHSYLQHDPTKRHKRAKKQRRGGPRYVTKGFFG